MPCSGIDSTGAIRPDRVGIEIDDLETLMSLIEIDDLETLMSLSTCSADERYGKYSVSLSTSGEERFREVLFEYLCR